MDKQQSIIKMFDDISPTYDRLNRVLSFGVDRGWRKRGCESALSLFSGDRATLIDVATGTGDLILFWRKAAVKLRKTIDRVIGVDPSQNMLNIAATKRLNATLINCEASAVPLPDNAADLLSISYGIRNVIEIDKALAEFYRLLKPNGVLLILEFMSRKRQTPLDRIASFYLRRVLPTLGGLISKDPRAYAYLSESIGAFLSAKELGEKLTSIGFEIAQIKEETFGINTRFVARKPL
ncbi:MAG: bifunctional demethylmenaquinone methyltransferase/2-methoxy-6-polyprenyl-1,4-benzoquinol methylase UbiE [Helicobacteraceae bacterium]|jgi:demethylmenaquinone methyltransferase/2-methoxy-6-polyprenyl-1,4-benzoquinol methylase|nr:bifunctional demethylmenaquinone methyltransferase/2-methoxy-6-polyprenyl-1,4-benzoquinol methylase UbiE [Helicobacteraceae bacterium]